MPTLTRWSIKGAMIYLIAAMAVALLLAATRLWSLPGWIGRLNPVYFHLLMVGWVTQLIFGVVYWMFPITTRQRPRGSERLGWAAFACLNGAPQWLAGLFFVVNSWPRVRDRYRGE